MPRSDVSTVLVVGCGYIGLPLARLAKAAGGKIFATIRKRERFAELDAEGLIPVLWDVSGTDYEALIQQFSQTRELPDVNDELPEVDAVVWAVGYDRSVRKSIEEVYVSGLLKTLTDL